MIVVVKFKFRLMVAIDPWHKAAEKSLQVLKKKFVKR